MYRKILLPIDLAEPDLGQKAVEEAMALGRDSAAELRLVAVQPTPPILVDYQHLAPQRKLDAFVSKIDYPREHISAVVRFGAVCDEVLSEAQAWGADIIVLSSHRPAMTTYLLGSNAANIVLQARCSVLVLR